LSQVSVDRFDVVLRRESSDDVWLVGHDDEHEPSMTQPVQRIRHARKDIEVLQGEGCLGLTRAEDFSVDHAVTVEKDRLLHRVVSHLVSAALTSGCDTSKCHITA